MSKVEKIEAAEVVQEPAPVDHRHALFGDHTTKVTSRGGGPTISIHAASLPLAGLKNALDAGLADIFNAKTVANLTKPVKEDFLDDTEHKAALAGFEAEKNRRKTEGAAHFQVHGELPDYKAKSWASPLKAEINRIAEADLRRFFGGSPVRQSTPAKVYDMPTGAALAALVAKWLNKYGPEIAKEARDNMASGTSALLDAPDAGAVEF